MLCRIFVSCSKLALEKVPVIRQELANHVTEALNHAPSVVIFDDLDSIISTPDSEGSQLLMSVAGLTDFLIDIMDEYRVRSMPFLLCSASGLWFGSHNLPLPGHVLIYGPSVSTTYILLTLTCNEHDYL